jgi:CheY-like chemotaxis protein
MGGNSILIVEDDTILARVEEWRLKKIGYRVCGRAVTGAEAIRLAAALKPDAVLMDVGLPGDIDGIETARMIKEESGIPVIFVTSYSDANTLERAKTTHPDGYIVKPFEDNDLRVAIGLALKI